MKKATILFLMPFLALCASGQTFEGKIVYKNTYKSKIANVTDEQLTSMLGTTQEYFVKGGNYKSVTNGSFTQWQIYVHKDNKLYNKVSNSEALLTIDAATNDDEVLKVELNKGVTEILGYKCDELILTCKSGLQKFYFNTGISADPSVFAKHKFANWFEFLSHSKSLPLKSIYDNVQFTLEIEATEVNQVKLEDSLFELPANSKE